MAGRLELLTTQKVLKIKGELQEQPGFAPRSPGWEHPRAEPENKARKGWKKTPQLGGCCALTLRAAPFPKLAAGNCRRAGDARGEEQHLQWPGSASPAGASPLPGQGKSSSPPKKNTNKPYKNNLSPFAEQ